ncbi:anthranilate synthase component I family protein [Petrotoga sp. 9PWA.NaAc.5.4]|uniref:anthranilate synthase component I family protein n=1 Tax=Petrotoga sp. 9PWA.NaAc.5.4 TaxID=1434328 RepID=UPI000CC1122A|nr:chorismate-binding protein [Petrotoga sp. 9PWA.NaAc.5.4]PNR93960.1 anthranilate synthase subunit I [Petrotoga sp. 9PWA.NaAc.5.4]
MKTITNYNKYNVLPIIKTIKYKAIDPALLYEGLAQMFEYSFILENIRFKEKIFSFIGIIPEKIIKFEKDKYDHFSLIIQAHTSSNQYLIDQEPIEYLKKELNYIKGPILPNIPDFYCSFVGYFGYEMIDFWEDIYHKNKGKKIKYGDLPLTTMILPKVSLIIDHSERLIHVVNCVYLTKDKNFQKELLEANFEITQMEKNIKLLLDSFEKEKDSNFIFINSSNYTSVENLIFHTKKNEFLDKVCKAKDYINSGDAFQIVLSQKFSIELTSNSFEIYKALRIMNPSPYMFYINTPEVQIFGTSPEMLVKVEQNKVITRPLAGTKARNKNLEKDLQVEKELLNDEKEKAEHIMLVDLARNDLGRVCIEKSVKVTKLFGIEKYSHVMHIYSQVEGIKKETISSLDVLKRVFPAGTVSGAPKIRAIEIINELEDEPREIYAGAIGYVDHNGNLDTSIAIRTIVCKKNKAIIQAGAGIVSYSDPEKEYYETLNKAKALFKAIGITEEAFNNF